VGSPTPSPECRGRPHRTEIGAKGDDQLSDLACAVDATVAWLRSLVAGIWAADREIASSSEKLRKTSDENALVVQQVADAIVQVAAGATSQAGHAYRAARDVREATPIIARLADRAARHMETLEPPARTVETVRGLGGGRGKERRGHRQGC
jgi:methyl-accepting chemotaxis protein